MKKKHKITVIDNTSDGNITIEIPKATPGYIILAIFSALAKHMAKRYGDIVACEEMFCDLIHETLQGEYWNED